MPQNTYILIILAVLVVYGKYVDAYISKPYSWLYIAFTGNLNGHVGKRPYGKQCDRDNIVDFTNILNLA